MTRYGGRRLPPMVTSMSAHRFPSLARVTGLSTTARQVAGFVAAVAVVVDLMVLVLEASSGTLVAGRGPLLDVWDAAKAGVLALGLMGVSVWRRSLAIGVVAVVFALVGIQDQVAWHSAMGQTLAGWLDLSFLARLSGAPESAVGEFLVLALLAVAGLVVAESVWEERLHLRAARNVLVMLLVLLTVFAVFVDLGTAASGNGGAVALVEEMGERTTLSLALGFTAGLVKNEL